MFSEQILAIMQVNITSFTREEVAAWNARWSEGSKISTQKLMKDLLFWVRETMQRDLEVSIHELGNWLLMNGWTPTRVYLSQRVWKKNPQTTNFAAAQVEDAMENITRSPQKESAKHRRWCIDFRKDRMPFSNLKRTKNVIFGDRAANEPSLYWEFDCFIKILNADKEKFSMGMWWQTHRPWYEKLLSEFDFHPLTLLPSRRSLARRPGIVKKTYCTEQTLMATRGLLTMLLHWATNTKMTHRKREAAEAMFNDLVDQNLGAQDQTDATWQTFRNFIQENNLNVLLADNQTAAKEQEKSLTKNDSLCEMITTSCMYLFANRQKCQDLHACLVKHLKMLETRISEIVLTGKVGHQAIGAEKQTTKLATETNKNRVQKSSSSLLTSKQTKTNLASAGVRNKSSDNKQNVTRMMKSEKVVRREEKQKNETNKKRKLVETEIAKE